VRAEVAGDLAGAHREADQDRVGQVQVLDQRGQVGGEGVVVVPDDRLAGPAESAPVVGDHPVAGLPQDAVLALPGVPVERVPVDQHDRLTLAVVPVVDVDVGAVLGADLDVRHGFLLLSPASERMPAVDMIVIVRRWQLARRAFAGW